MNSNSNYGSTVNVEGCSRQVHKSTQDQVKLRGGMMKCLFRKKKDKPLSFELRLIELKGIYLSRNNQVKLNLDALQP